MKRDQGVMDAALTREEKRRKIGEGDSGESELSTALIQLESHRKNTSVVVPENSVSPASLDGPKADHVEVSCISGHDGCELTEENVKFSDLDEERDDIATSKCNSEIGESGDTTPLREYQSEPGELESTVYSLKIKKSTPEKIMPSEAELEDFFAAAEKKIQKQFAEKYNFDIVEDKPLNGRYEWVQLQP